MIMLKERMKQAIYLCMLTKYLIYVCFYMYKIEYTQVISFFDSVLSFASGIV